MNYMNVIHYFADFANNDLRINKFGSDTLDKLPNFADKDEKFPLLYVVPINQYKINNVNGYKANRFIFNIYCLSPIIQIFESDESVNTNQTSININETFTILSDLYTKMEESNMFDFITDIVAYPINNYANNSLQGVYATFTFDVEDVRCEIPTLEQNDIIS